MIRLLPDLSIVAQFRGRARTVSLSGTATKDDLAKETSRRKSARWYYSAKGRAWREHNRIKRLEYWRNYNKSDSRRAYLTMKQREYRRRIKEAERIEAIERGIVTAPHWTRQTRGKDGKFSKRQSPS